MNWRHKGVPRKEISISIYLRMKGSKIYMQVKDFFSTAFSFFLKILFIFREGKGGRKKGRETSSCGSLLCTLYRRPSPRNPDMCHDWESNRQPFGSQASTQSTEPHQPGLFHCFLERKGEGGERETSTQEKHDWLTGCLP